MKKHIFSTQLGTLRLAIMALLMGIAFQLSAQTPSKTDTTEVIVGKKVITITFDSFTGKKDAQVRVLEDELGDQAFEDGNEDDDHDSGNDSEKKIKPVDVDVFNMDLGMNFMFLGKDSAGAPLPYESQPLRSTHVGLHFLKTRINFFKGHVGLVTALDLDNNRYQFTNDITLLPNQNEPTVRYDSIKYRKNKLITWHAQIPLLLSFQTNPSHPKKNFHVAVGGFAGLLIGANTKQKSAENGKVKKADDFNLNPILDIARNGFDNTVIDIKSGIVAHPHNT